MKVLLVTGTYPVLSETFIVRKADALARLGHEVTVATREVGDRSLLGGAGVRVVEVGHSVGLRRPARAWGALRAWLRALPAAARRRRPLPPGRLAERLGHLPFEAIDADVVHFEFIGMAMAYSTLPRRLGAAAVVSARGSDVNLLSLRGPDERRQVSDALRGVDVVHCVSDAIARRVHAETDGEASSIVVRPAVDPVPRGVERTASRPRVVAVGRLVWVKGYDHLLAACERLARRGVEFDVVIVGDGPLRVELQFGIKDLELDDRVVLRGPLHPLAVLDELRASDIFVLASHEEGISNSVLEAMAAGLAVVTTDAGGMREVVAHDDTGLVVPVRDISALADALERVILDPALRGRLGDAARRVSATRGLAEYAREMTALYEAAIARARARSA